MTVSKVSGVARGVGIALHGGVTGSAGVAGIDDLTLIRTFINLDPVLNSHYVLSTAVIFTGDFTINVKLATTAVSGAMIFSGGTGATGLELYKNTSGTLTLYYAGAAVFTVVAANVEDGKLHTASITRVGSTLTLTAGAASGSTTSITGNVQVTHAGSRDGTGFYFDGNIADLGFIDQSGAGDVPTTFRLDQATGTTENSIEGNNSITYVNIPESIREPLALDEDAGEWLGVVNRWFNPTLGTQWTESPAGVYSIIGDGSSNSMVHALSLGDMLRLTFTVAAIDTGLKATGFVTAPLIITAVGAFTEDIMLTSTNLSFARSGSNIVNATLQDIEVMTLLKVA